MIFTRDSTVRAFRGLLGESVGISLTIIDAICLWDYDLEI